MYTGVVKFFDNKKGFGFIIADEKRVSERDIFVHYSNISGNGYRTLKDKEHVKFEIIQTSKGIQAVNVEPMGL